MCLSFFALAGVGVLAAGDFLGFDTRSRADEIVLDELPTELQKGDINSDGLVNMDDYKEWIQVYRAYRRDPSEYLEKADLNSDGRINLEDLKTWLSVRREYRTYVRELPARVPTTVPPEEASENVPEDVPLREVPSQVPDTVPAGGG